MVPLFLGSQEVKRCADGSILLCWRDVYTINDPLPKRICTNAMSMERKMYYEWSFALTKVSNCCCKAVSRSAGRAGEVTHNYQWCPGSKEGHYVQMTISWWREYALVAVSWRWKFVLMKLSMVRIRGCTNPSGEAMYWWKCFDDEDISLVAISWQW